MSLEVVPSEVGSDTSGANPTTTHGQKVDSRLAVLILIAVSSLVHLIASGAIGLGADESYSVSNARIVSLSYVDYPPLHLWLVGAWVSLLHSESPLVVRLPFIAFFGGAIWLMFSLTRLLFGARAGLWAALAFGLAPVYALAQGYWVLPESPLAFFLLAGASVVARLMFAQAKPSTERTGWLCAGTLTGLAMLTKYHGVFLPAATFVFLMTWAPGHRVLRSPGPWIAACLALVMFLPVIVWNVDHGWVGLFFQSRRLTKTVDLSFLRMLIYIGEEAGYLSPWLFVPLAMVWMKALRDGPRVPKSWLLALLATGPVLFFTLASFFAKGLPHWPMPGWLFTFPLLGQQLVRFERARPRLLHNAALAVIGMTLCLLAVLVTEARYGWIVAGLPLQSAERDPTLDLLDWHDVQVTLRQRHIIDASTAAVAGTRWMDAGKLNYAIGRNVSVICLCDDPQQFRYLHDLSQFVGRDIIVIKTQREFERDTPNLDRWFDKVQLLEPIMLRRNGHDAIELAVFRGIGFKPPTTRQ